MPAPEPRRKKAGIKRRAPGGSTGRKPSLGPLSPREPRLRPSGRNEVERAALRAMKGERAFELAPRRATTSFTWAGLKRSKPMPKVSKVRKVRSKTRTGRAGPG
jgi:hypothetical protein